MARRNLIVEIDGDGAIWGAAGFAASLLLGVGLEPFRDSVGQENPPKTLADSPALLVRAGSGLETN